MVRRANDYRCLVGRLRGRTRFDGHRLIDSGTPMTILTDPFTPATFPDLFTWMWVAGILIAIGAIVVYNLAQRRYRRYPELLSLHEWVFWPIIVTWGIIPLLVVIGVPLVLQLAIVLTGMGIAAYAVFVRFPERSEERRVGKE